jgi:hypothetical protein
MGCNKEDPIPNIAWRRLGPPCASSTFSTLVKLSKCFISRFEHATDKMLVSEGLWRLYSMKFLVVLVA